MGTADFHATRVTANTSGSDSSRFVTFRYQNSSPTVLDREKSCLIFTLQYRSCRIRDPDYGKILECDVVTMPTPKLLR